MPIPAQVQAQADAADEKLKELSEAEKTPQPDPDKKPEDPTPIPPEKDTVEDLKQRLTVLQGKYNAEVKALKDDVTLLNNLKHQVRQLTAQNQELSRLTTDLQKQITEKPKETDQKTELPESVADVLSEEDRQFLEDSEGLSKQAINILSKMVQTMAAKQTPAPKSNELEDIKKDIVQTRAERFWSELDRSIVDMNGTPDWDPINKNDAFMDWLDELLPYSNTTRRQRLQDAQNQMDYKTVIQLFNDFKAQAKPAHTDPKPKLDPSKQIEPDTSVVHQPKPDGDVPEGKIYTRQEVNEFYSKSAVELGRSSTSRERKEEIARIDADILKAQKEGRIRG